TVSQVLQQQGALSVEALAPLLRQLLQTLTFLHQQKFVFPSGQVQTGLIHGNLSISSLLWHTSGQNIFLYATDFMLWERFFHPSLVELQLRDFASDLRAAGYIAFYLLAGRMNDALGQPLNPGLDYHWPLVNPDWKALILRLMGIDQPFPTAIAAAQALPESEVSIYEDITILGEKPLPERQPFNWRNLIPWLITLAVLLLFGGLVWFLLRLRQAPEVTPVPLPCCLEDVKAVPQGRFIYAGLAGGAWERLLELDTGSNAPGVRPSLMPLLQTAQPELGLSYLTAESPAMILEALRAGTLDFAILPIFEPLPIEFATETIAYDAVALLVPFNDHQREQSLPGALRGRITLAAAQELFTGQVRDWQQLGRLELPVRLYRPTNQAVTNVFESLVLQDSEAIATFESLPDTLIKTRDTIPMLRGMLQDFEIRNLGAIGFDSLSSIFGQCAVYPLAVVEQRRSAAQLLQLQDDRAVTPQVDLCDRKGFYQPAADVIRSGEYPLSYTLSVVYFRDNRRAPIGQKFAELMRTEAAQRLLQEFGLVPIRTLPPVSATDADPAAESPPPASTAPFELPPLETLPDQLPPEVPLDVPPVENPLDEIPLLDEVPLDLPVDPPQL
ncbi:MAG: substrate-binding domain-containing protein, partial [Cyanobacteria bacterium P01_H01_bin.121]